MERILRTALLSFLLADVVYTQCSTGCISCDGTICLRCDSSYYLFGFSCLRCPENCLNKECYDRTGYCVECEQGKYGNKCQRNCDLCKNENCGLYNCTEGCKYGYYEYQADIHYLCLECLANCKECVDGKKCRICNDGFYLQQLNINNNVYINCYKCPTGVDCSNYCSIEGCSQCQIYDNELVCTNCREGELFNGISCVQNTAMCSQGCSTSCDSNGICLGNCIDGWTGNKCSETCNERCLMCSKVDKDICLQCNGDYYLADCSLSCLQSCMKEEGNQTCRSIDGFCLNGCKQGFWDKNCDQSCSDGCNNPACERNTGNCIRTCKDGYVGDKCVPRPIKEATETPSASSAISPTMASQIKAVENGDNDFIIGLFSGIGISVVIVLIAAFIFLLRRRYLRNKQRRDDSNKDITPSYQNTGTDLEELNAGTVNASNTYESLRNNSGSEMIYSDLGTRPK